MNPRLTFSRKHLKQEDIFGHYTRNLEKHKCFQMRPNTVWKTLSTSWSMVSISIISNEIRTIWLLVVETEIIDYYIFDWQSHVQNVLRVLLRKKIKLLLSYLSSTWMKINIIYRYGSKFNYYYQHANKEKIQFYKNAVLTLRATSWNLYTTIRHSKITEVGFFGQVLSLATKLLRSLVLLMLLLFQQLGLSFNNLNTHIVCYGARIASNENKFARFLLC